MAADANLIRAVRGPITLITLGVLFTLDHFTPYSFNQTWPVLLIVFGLLSLMRRSVSRLQGPQAPVNDQPWPPPPSAMGGGYPPPSYSGGYRQSPYGSAPQGNAANPGDPRGGPR